MLLYITFAFFIISFIIIYKNLNNPSIRYLYGDYYWLGPIPPILNILYVKAQLLLQCD